MADDENLDLQLELQATQNTVRVLSSRVLDLEDEFTRIKNLLKKSVLIPAPAQVPGPPGTSVTANSSQSRLSSIRTPSAPAKNSAVYEVVVSSSDDEDEIAEVYDGTPNSENTYNGVPIEIVEDEKELESTMAISDDIKEMRPSSPEDSEDSDNVGKIRIKSPYELFGKRNPTYQKTEVSIWNNFQKTILETNGKRVVTMSCKFCNKDVKAKLEFLQNHLAKCNVATQRILRKKEKPSENKKATRSNSTSSTIVRVGKLRKSHSNGGRKKLPVWDYFDVIPRPRIPGAAHIKYLRRPLTAICKKCKSELSARTNRLTQHVEACSPQV